MQNNGWNRRDFLVGLPCLIAGVSVLAHGEGSGIYQAVPFSAGTERPHVKMPQNVTDCHHHIYNSRFPMAPNAILRPPEASVESYRLLQKRLGIVRHVVVQPSTYGVDNSSLVYALGEFGLNTTRGVAVVNTSVSDSELKDLDASGVRGIRFNLQTPGATTFDMVVPLSKRIADLGWHIQVNAFGDQIMANKDLWYQVPCPIVFDHLGHVPLPAGTSAPVFGLISDLLQKDKAWVKLSGAYMETKVGPPTYSDTIPIAQGYVKVAPERLVWGSDWPHPTEKVKPDDAVLLDLLTQWVPDQKTRDRILTDNPAKLYRF